MLKRLFFRQLEKQALSAVHHVRPVPPAQADALVARTYAQVRRDFGLLIAPMTLHSPAPELLAAVWMACRETLLTGALPQTHREAISAAVSRLNACPFCVDVHTMSLRAVGLHEAAEALEGVQTPSDLQIGRLVEWAAATRDPKASILSRPPFARDEAVEVMALALGFHYINRMVNVFLAESIFPVPARFPRLKLRLKRLAASMVRDLVDMHRTPGASLDLLPPADLPAAFAWATTDDRLAQVLARSNAAFERAGAEVLSASARQHIDTRLAQWHGEEMAMGNNWLEDALQPLEEKDRPAARLALLAALASYRVAPDDLAVFKKHYPEDRYLIAAVGWGAFAAVRRIATWLAPATKCP